jgi:Fanconi-associated nuclease 1
MSLLDYWETQRGKRRKVSGESPNEYPAVDQEAPLSPSPSVEVADTPAPAYEDAETQIPPSSQTDLETALPPIKTDNQAIEEYEASRATKQEDNSEPGLHVRLRDGVWQKGRSSIYVDAFNLALDTVLAEEAHLFDEAEMEVFRQWRELSYQSQYLYVFAF